jgi:hypothetical protein
MICVRSLGLARKRKKSNSENPEFEQASQSESSQKEKTERDIVFDSQFLEDLTL